MSQSGYYCYHDGFNGCYSMNEYKEKIKGCGDSSTGLTVFNLNKYFPNSKVVIIEKNDFEFEQCVSWCKETFGGSNPRLELEKMRERQSKIKGLRVGQCDINNKLREIWEYLVDTPWHDKYLKLTQFNIQSDPFDINLNAAKRLYESIQQNQLNG